MHIEWTPQFFSNYQVTIFKKQINQFYHPLEDVDLEI